MMLLKKQYMNNSDKYYNSSIRFGFIILLYFFNFKTSSCEPISGLSQPSSSSSSSSSASSALTGGTWTLRAIPHQSSTTYSTLYEQMQNLKYQWESSIDHVMRKIELLESKIGRLDTSNQLRLEKLTESVNSKEIKDELAMEQLMRKLDANYERINHKIGYMETRLDTTLNKMQNALDNGFNRIETHQNDIDTELTDINQSVEEIKTLTIQMEDKHNTTQKSMQHHFQTIMSESASRDQIEKLSGTIQHIGVKLNDTNYSVTSQNQNQNDASGQIGSDSDKIVQTIKTEIDRESHRIENKISNMYNDLWRRFMSLEMTVKTVLTYGNTTRRQLQEDLRTLLQQYDKQKNAEPDSQENYIEVVMDAVMSTMQELTRKVDSNFQMVMTSQNLFLDNCHRLQLEEPQLESKISLVLEKILTTITNKTMRFDNRLVETMEMIKSHQSQVLRSLGHTTKMLVTLAEETNQEKKNLESALLELAERNVIVSMTIQELQEDIEILTNVTSAKLNNEIEDWFNKTMIENNSSNEYDSEEIMHRTIDERSSIESTVISTVPTQTTNENNTSNYKNIKYPESDEVLKIFTEGDHLNYNNNNNNETERLNDKKISIIIPHRLHNSTEFNNSMNNITRTKLYRILLQDILNQTYEPINVEEVSAIILNTEGDKENNCTNEREKCNENITKSLTKDDMLIAINNETSLEDQNEMIDYITKNSSEIISLSSEDITDLINNTDKLNNYDKNKENNTESSINSRIQNLTEIIKNKLNSFRNQKYKLNNQDTNQNKTVFQFIQQVTQNKNNNMKRLLEQFNKKRKFQNLLTRNKPKIHNENIQSESTNMRIPDENIITQNVTRTNDPEGVKLNENLQSDAKDTNLNPEKINNEQFIVGDVPSQLQLSNEFTNTDDNNNFYDAKHQNTDSDLINPYMTDLEDQY